MVANSCIMRRNIAQGSFVLTGNGGMAQLPSYNLDLPYSVITPRAVNISVTNYKATTETWKVGASITEATGLVKTSDGRLVLTANTGDKYMSVDNLSCI